MDVVQGEKDQKASMYKRRGQCLLLIQKIDGWQREIVNDRGNEGASARMSRYVADTRRCSGGSQVQAQVQGL